MGWRLKAAEGSLAALGDKLTFFVFRDGQVVHLKSDDTLVLSADNQGAEPENGIEIDGSWVIDRVSNAQVGIEYRIKQHGRLARAQAVWAVAGDRLNLIAGAVPPEVTQARGN